MTEKNKKYENVISIIFRIISIIFGVIVALSFASNYYLFGSLCIINEW